jgi:hypothetical protein
MQHATRHICLLLGMVCLFSLAHGQRQKQQCGLGQKCCLSCPPEIRPEGMGWAISDQGQQSAPSLPHCTHTSGYVCCCLHSQHATPRAALLLLLAAECDQRECSGSLTCHMFGMRTAKTGDGKTQADMNVCLQSPQVGSQTLQFPVLLEQPGAVGDP